MLVWLFFVLLMEQIVPIINVCVDLCIAKFICLMCRYVDVYVLACIFTFLLNLVIVCIFVMFSSYIFYSVPSACVYVILLIFCNSNVLIRGGKLSCSKTKRKKKQNEKLSRRVGYLYIFLYQAIEAGWLMLKSAFKFEELRKHEINKHFDKMTGHECRSFFLVFSFFITVFVDSIFLILIVFLRHKTQKAIWNEKTL